MEQQWNESGVKLIVSTMFGIIIVAILNSGNCKHYNMANNKRKVWIFCIEHFYSDTLLSSSKINFYRFKETGRLNKKPWGMF